MVALGLLVVFALISIIKVSSSQLLASAASTSTRKRVNKKVYTISAIEPHLHTPIQAIDPNPREAAAAAAVAEVEVEIKPIDQCLQETDAIFSKLPEQRLISVDEWKQFCPGFPNEKKLKCDFQSFKTYNQQACNDAGGKLLAISFEVCSTNLYINDGISDPYYIPFDRVEFGNFYQCASPTCNRNMITKAINADNENIGLDCPKEKPFAKFIQKYNKNGKLVQKNCKWLKERKNVKLIEKICQNKKFQLYDDTVLPASRICPITCEPYSCVQEKDTAFFYLGLKDGVADIRSCKWLSKLSAEKISDFCRPSHGYLKGRYGYGYEVCTTTCPDSCLYINK